MEHQDRDQGVAKKAGDPCWRLPRGAELLWQSWDEEVIVFNTASGQTHLLDALSAAVLKEIQNRPSTVSQLTNAFAERFNFEPESLSQRLADICARFDELGLAEPQRT